MGKYKYLLKNMGLLTISQFGAKLLSFLLVPLYTSILTTEEYGTFDFFNTTIFLLVPILTISIMQSVMRFCLDKTSDKQAVFSIGLKIVTQGSFIFLALILLNKYLNLIPILNQYTAFLILMYVTSALNELFSCFARGIDDMVAISISGILSTAVMLGLNILFLVYLKMGIVGYFYANIISVAMSVLFLAIHTKFWKYVRFSSLPASLRKEMIAYSTPLILNSIAWWVNNASDRYAIIALCGVAANGVYAVGYKIPNILNMFQTVFNQVWTLSAVKDYDKDDNSGFFSQIYNIYNFLLVLVCAILIAGARILAHLLYAGDFFMAWQYVPFLMIAIIFGALSGYIGGIFSAVKNSKVYAYSTVVGAVSNIILNIVLILWLGPLGAAVATSASYCIVWIIRLIHLRKYIKIRINILRDCCAYGILVLQSILLLIIRQETLLLYALQLGLICLLICLFLKELKNTVTTLLQKFKNSGSKGEHTDAPSE